MFEVPGIIPLARAALRLAGPVVRTAVGLGVQPHPEPGGKEERRWRLPSQPHHRGCQQARAPCVKCALAHDSGLGICVLAAGLFMQRGGGGHEQPV